MTEPANPAGSCPDALDIGVFHDLRNSLGDQPDALIAVYRKFLGNAAAFIVALRDQDSAARVGTLHTLKGSAAMLGATGIAALAARLQENFPDSAEAIAALESELAAFRSSVAAALGSLGESAEL